MSTQINVTVGSGGLPDKAKQQQQAARQAQLEKERQRRIEAEGAAQRTTRLAAEGRNAQGQSLTGTPNAAPRLQDEPAAYRSVTADVGTAWLFGTQTQYPSNLGPTGWIGRDQSNPFPYVQNFSSQVQNERLNTFCASGSGKTHITNQYNSTAKQQVYAEGTASLVTTADSYTALAPGVYYRSSKYYFFNHDAVQTIQQSSPTDQAILPTGNGNAILLILNRTITSQQRYSMGGYYYETYNSSGVFTGTVPSDTNIHTGTSQSGFFPVQDSTGTIVNIPVPKGFYAYSIALGYDESYRAYAINKNTIREITFPTTFKNLIKAKWPLLYQQDTIFLYGGGESYSATTYQTGLTLLGNWSGAMFSRTGYQQSVAVDGQSRRVASPEVFKVINNDITFTSPASIKEYNPALYQAVVQDRRTGLFSYYANSKCTGNTSYQNNSQDTGIKNLYGTYDFIDFALWANKGEVPDYSVFNTAGCPITPSLPLVKTNKKFRTTMFPGRPAAPSPPFGSFDILASIYDGGDPKYCQAMCRALGFANSDFNP